MVMKKTAHVLGNSTRTSSPAKCHHTVHLVETIDETPRTKKNMTYAGTLTPLGETSCSVRKTTFQKQKSGLLVREGLSGTLSTATPSKKKSSYQAASINTMVDKQVTSRSPTPRTKTRTQSARLTNTYRSHHDAICVWTWKAHRRSKRSMAAPLFSTRSPRSTSTKLFTSKTE